MRAIVGYRSLLRNHLLPDLDDRVLNRISVVDVDTWYARSAKKVVPVALKHR